MSAKRKRVVLSINEKLDIINRLKNGETSASLAKEFNIGTSTIADIKKSELKMLKFMTEVEGGYSTRKAIRSGMDERLDSAVYQWFVQKRKEGENINGPILCEKALEFNTSMGGSPYFKASSGWLQRFKLRHGIKMNEPCDDSDFYKNDFQKRLEECIKEEKEKLENRVCVSISGATENINNGTAFDGDLPEKELQHRIEEYIKKEDMEIEKRVCVNISNEKENTKNGTVSDDSLSKKQFLQNTFEEYIKIEKVELDNRVCLNISIGKENPSNGSVTESTSKLSQIEERLLDRSSLEVVCKGDTNEIPSHSDALQALHTALKWYENQDDVDTHLLTSLNKVLDIAAKKALSNFFMLM